MNLPPKTGDGPIPVKWMAPETLFQQRYTTQARTQVNGLFVRAQSIGGQSVVITIKRHLNLKAPTLDAMYSYLQVIYQTENSRIRNFKLSSSRCDWGAEKAGGKITPPFFEVRCTLPTSS